MKLHKLLRPKSLAETLGISLTTLWRLEKAGKLPPKIRIGSRSVGWRSDQIQDMLANLSKEYADE
jgi:predicted DNA-binding transcriptional regulator AlpA